MLSGKPLRMVPALQPFGWWGQHSVTDILIADEMGCKVFAPRFGAPGFAAVVRFRQSYQPGIHPHTEPHYGTALYFRRTTLQWRSRREIARQIRENRNIMSLQENKDLILEHYEAFVHRQDAELVRRQLSDDFHDHDMPPGIPRGPEGALQFRAILHRAFPDLRVRLDDMVAEGDCVAVRATWTGTIADRCRCFPSHRQSVHSSFSGWCSGAFARAGSWSVGPFLIASDSSNN